MTSVISWTTQFQQTIGHLSLFSLSFSLSTTGGTTATRERSQKFFNAPIKTKTKVTRNFLGCFMPSSWCTEMQTTRRSRRQLRPCQFRFDRIELWVCVPLVSLSLCKWGNKYECISNWIPSESQLHAREMEMTSLGVMATLVHGKQLRLPLQSMQHLKSCLPFPCTSVVLLQQLGQVKRVLPDGLF